MENDETEYLHRLPCESEAQLQEVQDIAKQYDQYAWIDGTQVKMITNRRLLFADQQKLPPGIFNDQFV